MTRNRLFGLFLSLSFAFCPSFALAKQADSQTAVQPAKGAPAGKTAAPAETPAKRHVRSKKGTAVKGQEGATKTPASKTESGASHKPATPAAE